MPHAQGDKGNVVLGRVDAPLGGEVVGRTCVKLVHFSLVYGDVYRFYFVCESKLVPVIFQKYLFLKYEF